jgi:hypothetical protein
MEEAASNENPYGDPFILSAFFSVVWKYRKLILFGTLGATVLSAVISLFIPRVYRSEGFYQLGNPVYSLDQTENSSKASSIGVPVPYYKSSSSEFFNPNRFQLAASRYPLFSDEDVSVIKREFRRPSDISRCIKPVYAYAREDMRELAYQPKDETNSVIGVSLNCEAVSGEKAAACVRFLGSYVRDCLLYAKLYNYLVDGYRQAQSEIGLFENRIIETRAQILQNSNKLKDIQAILVKYPESEKIENRQLVSVQEGGSRFLAPVTQLVGIESALADLRQLLAQLERRKEMAAIREEYFSRCTSELQKIDKLGEPFFTMLKAVKEDVFNRHDLRQDTVKEVFNDLNIDAQEIELIFYSTSHFVSGPIIPATHFKPWRSAIVAVTGLLSFVFFVVTALALHWWQQNKKDIFAQRAEQS